MSITVHGRGVVRVPRDTAVLHLGLESRAAAAADALAGAQAAQAEAMSVLLRHVEERQVSSDGLSLHPDYRDGEESGFLAGHTLRVSAVPIEQATELIAALASEIGDRLRLHGLELTASDTIAAEREARELAMADARMRAEHLATLAGGQLAHVLSVDDRVGDAPATYAIRADAKRGGSVQGGEAEVEQSVTVTWALV